MTETPTQRLAAALGYKYPDAAEIERALKSIGCVVVPVEPTEEMADIGGRHWRDLWRPLQPPPGAYKRKACDAYKAMIAAARKEGPTDT